jgi:hypothetical protein
MMLRSLAAIAMTLATALVAGLLGDWKVGRVAAAEARPRVIVSTDAGGTDYDDLQSLVHLFAYADEVEIEGLVSSPYGPGRVADILRVIDVYARDYPALRTHAALYPEPDALRRVAVQGAVESAGPAGFGDPTPGSDWIVRCGRRADPRPLWVRVWGGIDDVAQALHDDPAIADRLRVYFIGGPNKKWSATAYDYLVREHPRLWMIEANSTYRGWFVGGDQSGAWGNETFVANQVAGRGALGDYFAEGIAFRGEQRSTLKMGDSPSLAYLLEGVPDDPAHGSWGGRFVRAWDRGRLVWRRPPQADDQAETFRVVEIVLASTTDRGRSPTATLVVDGQRCSGTRDDDGGWHFWFCPKESKTWRYAVESDDPAIGDLRGEFTSVPAAPARAAEPDGRHPHWWTDDPDPEVAEGPHQGARTVSRWRREFLADFALRLSRCRAARDETDPPAVP